MSKVIHVRIKALDSCVPECATVQKDIDSEWLELLLKAKKNRSFNRGGKTFYKTEYGTKSMMEV